MRVVLKNVYLQTNRHRSISGWIDMDGELTDVDRNWTENGQIESDNLLLHTSYY